MQTKLTLSMPAQTVRRGKMVAKARKQSLSEMVAAFLESQDPAPPSEHTVGVRIAQMYGSYSLPAQLDSADLRFAALLAKHLP